MASAVGSLIPPGARSFGKYELLARLATGGMAEIFLARRRGAEPGEPMLVIKRILPHLAEDGRFVAMFRDEARLAARIEHVNACRVLDVGTVGETYFMAMEYLHGVPLSRILLRASRAREPLDVRFIGAIMRQSCAGLHCAHQLAAPDGRVLDVVHRDVSPPNIFVDTQGVVKLIDFGVAKARGASQKTRTGTVKGKNAYMSPEQVMGETIDRRSDVFSLGIVLYESLTAQRLFLRDTDFETFRAITKGDPPDVVSRRPDVSPALAAVVARSLERDKEKRYATAQELSDAVTEAIADRGGPASEKEVAAYVHAHFSKELAAKQELLDVAVAPEGAARPARSLQMDIAVAPDDEEVATSLHERRAGPTMEGPPPVEPEPVAVAVAVNDHVNEPEPEPEPAHEHEHEPQAPGPEATTRRRAGAPSWLVVVAFVSIAAFTAFAVLHWLL